MTQTPVVLDDDQWAAVLDALDDRDGERAAACRDAIRAQVDTDAGTLDPDTAFELLSDPVRRKLLRTCRECGDVTVDELAETVATDVDLGAERLGIDLHHRHLPKLTNAGVVTVDGDTLRYAGDQLLDRLVAVGPE